ncbi:UNVERIFIED_CONTAM: hypothetical protein GTU68_053573, partial [Idotea baltica]|nr:hypothetical protein [Idotea baltica]
MTKSIKLLFNAIRDFKDIDGRHLSEVFLKLPPKTLYPDYYEVIKQPIDLDRILYKWKNGAYSSLDDIMADLTLMFQNACRYNEPESQIYRDALTLQRLSLQKRLELSSREECVPNVCGLVQELLMSLFISVFNHETSDGRYTSDSFVELPDYEEVDGQRMRALSFDIVKRRLDKCLYTRLDQFQDDIFSIFERARKHSKVNTRIYADSIILQKVYIKVRDELCDGGNVLRSRALNFKESHLNELLKKSANHREEIVKEDTNDGITEDEDSKASLQPSD